MTARVSFVKVSALLPRLILCWLMITEINCASTFFAELNCCEGMNRPT